MKFFTKYNRPPRVSSPVGVKTLTDSQYLPDCDINKVMKRALAGDTSLVNTSKPVFADVDDYGDFLTNMNKVIEGRRHFEALPSEIRQKFGHDPVNLISFLADSKNDEEAIKLGLKVRKVEPSPVQVEVINSSVTTENKGAES